MDIEKTYDEYNRVLNDLARMMPDDPNYTKTLEAAESLAKIIGDYERRDLDRINNNVRNDIQEEQLHVDMAKVKADKTRSWLGFGQSVLGLTGAVCMGVLSYKKEMEDFVLPVRNALDWAKKLIRF